jgi:hypothetical protein
MCTIYEAPSDSETGLLSYNFVRALNLSLPVVFETLVPNLFCLFYFLG